MGESNSALVICPRGSGKTMLLQSVLDEVKSDKIAKENLLQVNLNGLLQTDDRIALKEITRQLQLENTLGDKVFGSFAATLAFRLEALKSGDKTSRPILFVWEEFDLFAHNKTRHCCTICLISPSQLRHPLLSSDSLVDVQVTQIKFDISQSTQTPIAVIGLTYRLSAQAPIDVIGLTCGLVSHFDKFDIAQSAQTPIAVMELTCKLDVMELLEKRMKSCFSHRQIHIFRSLTFEEYKEVFVKILSLPREKIYAAMESTQLSEETMTVDVLQRLYHSDKNIRALKSFLLLPVCKLTPDHCQLESTDFLESSQYLTMDSKAAMLHEYQTFVQRKGHSIQCYEKPVVLKAFEHLQALELLKPVDGGQRSQKEYRPMTLLVDASQINDALQKYPNCPTEVKQWNTQEVHA
ncbi:origin recognition complex subunit 4-like [Ptychodera flava]|uniref:origin recognition complex subunit 4-like n=1 Tax=Ptychodera flava TaxID=63121 RepID=UPI00396A78C6